MWLFARWSLYVIPMIAAVSLQIPGAFAQEPQFIPAAREEPVLPDAPEPQGSSFISDGRFVIGQNRSDTQREQRPSAFDPTSVHVSGTVTNVNGDVVPGAAVVIEGPDAEDRRTTFSNGLGAFQFDGLKASVPYQITVEAKDFERWRSETILLDPGQYYYLKDIKLKVPELVTSVTVYADRERIATEQVRVEMKQRVFGFFPNFWVTYDANPVPLSTKLKFQLAFRSDTDPITFLGVAFLAGIYQAGDLPDYGQGAQGFAKRMGAGYADTTSDIFLGGAILPWAFRQDPRYFYKGTGTKKSRTLHAISSPFVCKGDNGKTQLNYSSLLGDLGSGALSNLYYPESNRGVKLLFGGFLITSGVRMVNGLLQEFLLRNLTPAARSQL